MITVLEKDEILKSLRTETAYGYYIGIFSMFFLQLQ